MEVKEIEKLFAEFVAPNGVSQKKVGSSCNYIIKSKYKYTIVILHDTVMNQFSITLEYPKTKYELSEYELYKEYDKKKAKKKLFGKKTIDDHLKVLCQFLTEHKDILFEEHTLDVFFDHQIKGYGKMFI